MRKPYTVERRYTGGNDVWLKYFPNAGEWSTYKRYAKLEGARMSINSVECCTFGCKYEYRIVIDITQEAS